MSVTVSRLVLAALVAVAGILAWQHQNKLYENKGRLAIAVRGQTAVLAWDSKVELPMARRISEAFETSKNEVKRFILVLNSPGGSLHEGGEVIKVLDQIKRSHEVHTLVGSRKVCLSMCVPIYLQGQRRLAAPDSRWMFHEPIHVDAHTGDEVNKPNFEREFFARRFFERYFTNSQMDSGWRRRLEAEWKGKEIWKTGQQLVDERANIVTELVSPGGQSL